LRRARRIRFILATEVLDGPGHGIHHHIVCGLLHRLSFWLRNARSNFANSKTESAATPAVPQLDGKAGAFFESRSKHSIYHWCNDP
jgi:hypothetical protein